MASEPHTASRRAILGALAVIPAVAIPSTAFAGDASEWERKLKRFYLLRALMVADGSFGALKQAERVHALDKMRRGDRPGEANSIAAEVAFNKLSEAEEANYERYTKPFWQAGRELVMTPAPTAEALALKVEIIREEEIWNDSQLPGDAMDYVLADARRLGA